MMNKYKNTYRIPSARLQGWDYARQGAYFITICTEGGRYLFGDIKGNEMVLSDMGFIALEEWEKSFEIRKELFCDAYVIMPNHIHGLVRIMNTDTGVSAIPTVVETHGHVETHGRASLQYGPRSNHGVAYRSPKSISSFVAGFKSSVTKRINTHRGTPGQTIWQTRFYDYIIRNENECLNIRQYIETNIDGWAKDKLYVG